MGRRGAVLVLVTLAACTDLGGLVGTPPDGGADSASPPGDDGGGRDVLVADATDAANATDASDDASGDADAGDAGHKRIFLTSSQPMAAGVASIVAADTRCEDLAKTAILGGHFVAWLSDATTNALDRIPDVGPWYSMDGAMVFASRAQIVLGPVHPINRDELGRVIGSGLAVWTGTYPDGGRAPQTCTNWTTNDNAGRALIGIVGATSSEWTQAATLGGLAPCDYVAPIMCFEK